MESVSFLMSLDRTSEAALMVDPKRAPGIGSLAMSLFPSGRCEYTGSLVSRPTTASSQCRELAYDTTDASGVLRLGDVPNGIVPLLKEATSHKLGRCEFRVESERSRRGGTP